VLMRTQNHRKSQLEAILADISDWVVRAHAGSSAHWRRVGRHHDQFSLLRM
jgi:hypothetical protein